MPFANDLYCYLFYDNEKQTERSKGSHTSALHNIYLHEVDW